MNNNTTNQTPKKEPSNTLIYVSNLPFDTNDEQLRDLFKGFNIKTAYVARRKNGKSKGFGFVNLEKESDQNAAIQKVNEKELNSRKLIARVAFNDERRNENGELREEFKTQQTNQVASETVVYVSNLAWSVTDEELKKIFGEFNPKVVTVASRRNGRSKGFGFVEFNSKEDREKALSLDQKSFHERTITVKPSTGYRGDNQSDSNNQSRRNNNNNNNRRNNNNNRNRNNSRRRDRSPTKRSPSGNNNNNNNYNNNNNNNNNNNRSEYTIYIKNLPFELDETDLKDVFSEFNPLSANIPRRFGRSKGYGFVEFKTSKDQNDALRALDQSEINGRVVSISISNNRSSSPRRNNNNNRSRERRNNNNNRSRERRNNRSPRRRGSRERNNNYNRNEKSNVSSQPSTTNAYVSNIPFNIDENKLGEFFKEFKVNKLTIPRKRNGRSFGYAFIEFASNEDQQRALKLNDTLIEGRKVVVQAAFQRDNNNTTSTPTTNNNNTQSK